MSKVKLLTPHEVIVAKDAEIERLRAALASIPEKIGHMRETHAVLHKAEHAQSWGDGYTTAQQIALNIANGVIEQTTTEKSA